MPRPLLLLGCALLGCTSLLDADGDAAPPDHGALADGLLGYLDP